MAVRSVHGQLNYLELQESADYWSDFLPFESNDTLIGIWMERKPQAIAQLVAMMGAGYSYLPLDPKWPENRLRTVVKEAGLKFVFPNDAHTVPALKAGLKILEPRVQQSKKPKASGGYVLFTSGSTGIPKGVQMGEKALTNLITWQNNRSAHQAGKSTLQFASLGFDVSFQEIWSTLTQGGTLTLVDNEVLLEPSVFLEYLKREQVTRLFLPFVALQYLAEESNRVGALLPDLNEIITAGEQLKITTQVRKFFSSHPNCSLDNQYGPTECHVVSAEMMSGAAASWPSLPSIGQAIDGVALWIANPETLEEVRRGESGELLVSGICLAQGYINNSQLTDSQFIQWSNAKSEVMRVYRTGDLAQIDENGCLQFLGRIDTQVKISGYRIECGEIESVATQIGGIHQVAVVARENNGLPQLVGFVERGDTVLDIDGINQYLARFLPHYMIPAKWVTIDKFPLTSSNKIDRNQLPNPFVNEEIGKGASHPLTLKDIWCQGLGINEIDETKSFFEQGGSSLLAVKLLNAVERQFGKRPKIAEFYAKPFYSALSDWIDGKDDALQAGSEDFSSTKSNSHQTIAVISIAGQFPGANDILELWKLVNCGKEGISYFDDAEIEEDASHPDYIKARGVIPTVKGFDASFFHTNAKQAALIDPQQRLFLEVAYWLLEKAGLARETTTKRIGVYAGVGNNSYYHKNILPNEELVNQFGEFQLMSYNEKDYVASRVSYTLGLKGPAVSIHTACSTSLLAVVQAAESLLMGHCDLAIAGGAAVNSPINSGHLYQEGAIYSKDGHTRVFDAGATGTVFSDGGGVVLLKRYSDAVRDGDFIWGTLEGWAVNNDGSGKTAFSAPSAAGQADVIRQAWERFGLNASQLGYIEAHGTATPIGDPIEIQGLRTVFGTLPPASVKIGSIKSNLGHLTAAAGVTGLIHTLLEMQFGVQSGTLHFREGNPEIPWDKIPFYASSTTLPWPEGKPLAGVSSFGVGGTNVHVVIKKPDASPAFDALKSVPGPYLFTLSGDDEVSLRQYGKKLTDQAKDIEVLLSASEIADALLFKSKGRLFRKTFVLHEWKDFPDTFTKWSESHPVNSKRPKVKPTIAFLFPGQGSQVFGMARELYEAWPVFRDAVDYCLDHLSLLSELDFKAQLLGSITPSQSLIHQTQYTQPCLFVFGYAINRLWESMDVKPDVLLGHSIGEILAAHEAGVFSIEDALQIVEARGRLMSQMPEGKMLIVFESLEVVTRFLSNDLSLAVVNGEKSIVVGGSEGAISQIFSELEGLSIRSMVLATSHAFHTPMMDGMLMDYEKVLKSIHFQQPRIPIISSKTGEFLRPEEATSIGYWVKQVAEPVQFLSASTTLLKSYPQLLVIESGPDKSTGNLVRAAGVSTDQKIIASSGLQVLQSRKATWLQAVGTLIELDIISPQVSLNQRLRFALQILPSYQYNRVPCWIGPLTKTKQHPSTLSRPHFVNPLTEALPVVNPGMTMSKKEILIASLIDLFEEASGMELNADMPQQGFIEAGLDSLLLTSIALQLKKKYEVSVSFRQLNDELGNLDSLADYLLSRLPETSPIYAMSGKPNVGASIPSTPAAVALTQPFSVLQGDSLSIIAQQIALLSQQVALLQNGTAQILNPVSHAMGTTPIAKPPVQSENHISEEELAEIKKPFGATARIERQTTELNDNQKVFLQEFIARYNARTGKSKSYTQSHRSQVADPRVVSGFKPLTKELTYPIVVNRSKGAKVWDIDDNEYIDVLNGFGSNLLGYSPEVITESLHQQIDTGYEIGPQHELIGEVSSLFCELTRADRVAFCNTGSEAVLGAMRIARTVTGRSLIVAFTGAYHGIVDEVIVRGTKSLKSFPAAPGIMPEAVSNMLVLDYGTPESLAIIRERKLEIAAVLVEPVQSRRPEFQPVEFLKDLRDICHSSCTALIFDEVITGFRVHPGGCQAVFGIEADIATYGKIVGGGMPIGAIAGKKAWMDALDGGFWQYGDESVPEAGVTYFAGTFVRHPLALAAASSILNYMKSKGPDLQKGINDLTDYLASEINRVCESLELPLYAAHFGSLWKLKWKEQPSYGELLFPLMREQGIHIWDLFPCFLTEAHTIDDVKRIISAFEESAKVLVDNGLMEVHYKSHIEPKAMAAPVQKLKPQSPIAFERAESAIDLPEVEPLEPPVQGAKLGKDADGNPAWFIADPANLGSYLQVVDRD